MLGIFLSRPGLACCQNSHMRKTIRPAMQAVLEGDSKTEKRGILTSLIHEVPRVPDTSNKSQPMEQNKLQIVLECCSSQNLTKFSYRLVNHL